MYLIVGCGLTGAVLAERLASIMNKKILIIEKRKHIGGNCYDYIDNKTGIRINMYGAHLFHTNSEKVWEYINKFDKWKRWEHKVLASVDKQLVPVPVNITTVNHLCNEHIKNTEDMNNWLDNNQIKYENPKNSEEMAKSRVGNELYEKMFKPYTIKQWNKEPTDLDASVLARIPVRDNYDPRYFSDKYQALPSNGYTSFIKNILKHKNIEIKLNTDFKNFIKTNDIKKFEGIIYTGPIDSYFYDSGLDKLEYRSIDFKIERFMNISGGYYQPNSVVNYPEIDVPFTRIVEYKHFLNQISPHTIIVSETSNDSGEPYYPVPNDKNKKLYEKYKLLAKNEEKNNNIHFIGRLASYKYFNMDQAIEVALDYFNNKLYKS